MQRGAWYQTGPARGWGLARLRWGSLRCERRCPHAPLGPPVRPGAHACPPAAVGGCGSAGTAAPRPICPAARALRTKAACILVCPWGAQGDRGPFPYPGLSLCPGGSGTLGRHHTRWSCPNSTLLKPTGSTVVRSRLCVATCLCLGAECSPRALVGGRPLLGSPRGTPAGWAEQEEESLHPWRPCFSAGVCPTLTASSGG